MKRLIIIILSIALLLSSLCSCSRNVYPISVTDFMLDTVISITVYNGDSKVLSGATKLCKAYENLFGKTVATSDIYKINHSDGRPVEVSDDTVGLIACALEISQASNGAFDPTVLPLVELWDVRHRTAPPDNSEVKAALSYVGHTQIKLSGNTVAVPKGVGLDLGGIAKGFIADKLRSYLTEHQVTSAVINLGGNTLLIGNKGNEPFTVGIQKPFGINGELSAVLELSNKTAVTSGTYQRFFKVAGKIYHHIINPSTGYPTDNKIDSVTVITDSSAIADGLSTACLNLDVKDAINLSKAYSAELVIITSEGELIVTDGLRLTESDGQSIIKLK